MQPLRHSDPAVLGGNRLLGVLGAGGMGQVYLALSPGGRHLAVKVIRDDFEGPTALARFRREVATVQAVHSPYTAALVGAGLDAPPYWLATEYVPGPTLAQAVAEHGPLPASTVRRLLGALAEALADIHAKGVQHRDLKPQNMILSVDGPKLIDFGIARGEDQTAITRTGTMAGTPGYLAPEVITRQEPSPAADVFALAGTIAYAATGRAPFGGGDAHAVNYRSIHQDMDLAGVDEGLAEVLRRCAAKDPAERPRAAEIAEPAAGPMAADPGYQRLLALTAPVPNSVEEAMASGLIPPGFGTGPAHGEGSGLILPGSGAGPARAGTVFPGPGTDSALGPGEARRTRSWAMLGAAAAVVAVALAVAVTVRFAGASHQGGGGLSPGASGTSGGASPTGGAATGTGATSGTGGTVTAAPTGLSRERTGADPLDLVYKPSTGLCEPAVKYEETPPGQVLFSAPRQSIEAKVGKPVQLGLWFKYGLPKNYYVAAGVLLPPEMRGNAGGYATTRPKLTGTNWTYLSYPGDFQGGLTTFKGTWTVLWFHVHNGDGQAYFIGCDGFTVT
jgi:hypothetical protein